MLTPELRDKVSDFLNRRVTVDDLIRWLRPRELSLLGDPDGLDSDLIAAVELAHAELQDGLCDENDFRHAVRAEWFRVICASSETRTCTFSSSSVVRIDASFRSLTSLRAMELTTVQSFASP